MGRRPRGAQPLVALGYARSMSTKVTRRQLAVGIVTGAAALGQTPVAPIPQTPDEELKAVQSQLRSNSETLGKVDVPQSTEPAFVFRP